MELTGKCKKDFEKWFLKDVKNQLKEIVGGWFDKQILNSLYNTLTNSMRYGVYVDWFFSVGIEVSINPVSYNISYSKDENPAYAFYPKRDFNNTRTKAIKKANGIYNSR